MLQKYIGGNAYRYFVRNFRETKCHCKEFYFALNNYPKFCIISFSDLTIIVYSLAIECFKSFVDERCNAFYSNLL